METNPVYVCSELVAIADSGSFTCKQWVVDSSQGFLALSQADSHVIGQFLVSFFVLCCAYAIIAKAIKLA